MDFKKYIIHKDKHRSRGFNLGITFKNHITFETYFDENCLYDFKDVDNYDINKLYGFSTTYFHHKQSARVGWRCLDGKNIEILTYSYNDGFRDYKDTDILGVVKPGQKFICSIVDLNDNYLYMFKRNGDKETIFYDKKKPDKFPFNYLLYPYFGGNKKAPHNMNIYIRTF